MLNDAANLYNVDILKGKWVRLREPLAICVDPVGEITVPADYISDLASIPRSLWVLLPPWDVHCKAAVIHDWLYDSQPCTRKDADLVFLNMMEGAGAGYVKRHTIYRAVRLGAGWAWNHRSKDYKGERTL